VTTQTADEITFYSPSGAKLAAYNVIAWSTEFRAVSTGYYEYFGGKMLKNSSGWVNQDRLGSVGKFFPYGQERPSATTNGTEKFATYFRDSETGLDYAQNRYHSAGDGRFLSPDPYQASGGPSDPGSWNRYAYTRGDPLNRFDRSGLQDDELPSVVRTRIDVIESGGSVGGGIAFPGGDEPIVCLPGPGCMPLSMACSLYGNDGGYGYGCPGDAGAIETETAGGSAPTSVSNVQAFATNPWSNVASAIKGTKCEAWLQGALDKSIYSNNGQTVNTFLTANDQIAPATATATFADGTAQATFGNALAPGYLILIRDGGFYFNAMPGSALPSYNYQQQIGGINGGSDRAKAFLLLHELSHLLGLIKPDATTANSSNSGGNNDTIWSHCGKELSGFKN
jgi:RHS repeat-associated protein